MNYLTTISKEYKKVILLSLSFSLIISILLLILSFFTKIPYYISICFIISCLASIISFCWLIIKVEQSVDAMIKRTIKIARIIRLAIFLITLVGLFFIFNRDPYIILTVVLGYIVLKIMILYQYGWKIKR